MKYTLSIFIATILFISSGQSVFCHENVLFFEIHSDTQQLINSTLGYKLKHNYESRFYKDPQTKEIQVILPNGKINTYSFVQGSYNPKINQKLPLTQTMTGYIITDQENQTSYTYDNNTNKLIAINTPKNAITLSYTLGNPLLNKVSNSDTTLTFTYNDTQQLTKINDTLGKTIEIQYKPNSQIPIVDEINENGNIQKLNQNQEINQKYIFESPYRKTLPEKYDAKIDTLIKKFQKEYSKTKWETLKRKVKETKETFLNKIQNLYFSMDCRYILEKIEES